MTRRPNPDVARMFDRIARTYDLLNRLFSLGIDRRWRAAAIQRLRLRPGVRLLDCSAGTGDMALTALAHEPNIEAVLLDPAQVMLLVADGKAGTVPPNRYRLVRAAAEGLPFPNETFDGFMVAFGIRNFADLAGGLRELSRTLKAGGIGVILEFTPERARLVNRMFRWYMVRVMQPLGALISRDREAYAYLTRTVEAFATSEKLMQVFTDAGLTCQENKRLSLGIARLFVLEKR
jgi:demethylmenaquinone methyltransferase / 2-methoxy-6-polyprenyl-1,4-benzoquinol methylase